MPNPSTSWDKVCHFMQSRSGVVLSSEQSYLLEGRLSAVAKAHAFASIDAFVDAACRAAAIDPLSKSLVDAMTTHESYFFRDGPFWKAFEDIVLPPLLARPTQALRIWSAACSHGQEVYSLLMLLEEKWPALASRVEIWATDISEAATLRGATGIYSSLEVNRGLTAMRLLKHFDKAEGGFVVKKQLRDRVRWGVHNLMDRPIGAAYDVVLCRNVLIYFNDSDRKVVLQHLTQATRPEGFIGLGTSELHLKGNIAPGWHVRAP